MEPGRLQRRIQIQFQQYGNRVRVWRLNGERLNPVFSLQRHTAPTAGVMVWGAIAYNTRSPLVLIRGTMTAQWSMTSCRHMCCHSGNGSQEPYFNKTMIGLTRKRCHKTVSALLLTHLILFHFDNSFLVR
ncbi:transposable element Tcb2 transposase [Trichonephila clavipes]|nr:transposable element Tcb2 transposase [Trichonephila clavipes]